MIIVCNLVISENCCNFMVLDYKDFQATTAMLTKESAYNALWTHNLRYFEFVELTLVFPIASIISLGSAKRMSSRPALMASRKWGNSD